jgi:hypothetical protein
MDNRIEQPTTQPPYNRTEQRPFEEEFQFEEWILSRIFFAAKRSHRIFHGRFVTKLSGPRSL